MTVTVAMEMDASAAPALAGGVGLWDKVQPGRVQARAHKAGPSELRAAAVAVAIGDGHLSAALGLAGVIALWGDVNARVARKEVDGLQREACHLYWPAQAHIHASARQFLPSRVCILAGSN